jgi:cytosine/adenosine deaminase-related metal-dependent hydrolase
MKAGDTPLLYIKRGQRKVLVAGLGGNRFTDRLAQAMLVWKGGPVRTTDLNRLHVIAAQWVLPMDAPPIEHGFVALADGKIVVVGPLSELPADWPAATARPGTVLTPGLVNAHMHLEQSFPEVIYKGADEPFSTWLLRVVARIQQESTPEDKFRRSLAGATEVLSTGTTCVNDIASGPESMQVLKQLGLRGTVSLEVFHPNVEPVVICHWVAQYNALKAASEGNLLLRVGLSPHSPFNVAPMAWQALLNECQPPLVHTHLAESEDEVRFLQGQPSDITVLHQQVLGREFQPQEQASSPVTYLHRGGLLNARTVAAHAIHTSETDRLLLAQAEVSVAHCPRSNMALHGCTLRASDWQALDIPLALGTDGRLSTENLDLRAEARYAMPLHGWTAENALHAMTVQGAKAMGLSDGIGTLTPGKFADLVLWQADNNASKTPYEAVMDESTQVAEVWIQGRLVWPLEGA